MKKIILTLLSIIFITPCMANIHIHPDTVVSVVKEYIQADKVNSVISEYNNQLKASNGNGISAKNLWNICNVAGWDIKQANDILQCQKFVNELVEKSNLEFYPACDKEYKNQHNYICVDDFFTNKFYGGTQVNLTPAITLAQEYIRIKYKDNTAQCKKTDARKITVVMGATDYGIQCTSYDQNKFYEFIFDDTTESKDKTIQDSIQNAVCHMYDAKATTAGCAGGGTNLSGTTTCWGPSCTADSAKCRKINQTMAKFGYSAIYKNNTCEINFNSINDKSKLKTAYDIDNFVFCHGIQVENTPNVETYLKQYVAERAGVPVSSVKCDSGFNTYTGTGCARNGITDFKDDIKTCRVGNNQIDFVFDDINEKWKKTVASGVQGMSCIVTGGTYSGKRCIGLGEEQCNILRQSNITQCPECKAAKWDTETQSCLLPSSASAQNLQKGINIALIAGGAVIGVALTVATAGTGTAIVLTTIESVGSSIELISQLRINAIADDFLITSNQCKNARCAKEMLSQNLQRMSNYYNEMTAAEADAIDSELERLANLIPDDDEIWATMLVNGTDMADNRLSFFDIDSWEPEQIWRAVGIGLQLTSVITSIGEWALKKSGRLAKSTATINTKFTATVNNINKAQEGALTGNRLELKRKIAQIRAATATDNLDETEALWRELHKKYAPRNQSLDDFKAITNGDIEEMRQMTKNWTSWDLDEEIQKIEQQIEEILSTNPDIAKSWNEDPYVAMERHPELAELINRGLQLKENGFLGNYSTVNPYFKEIKTQAQEQINLSEEMEQSLINTLNEQLKKGEKNITDAQREYDIKNHKIKESTTDQVLLNIEKNVQIKQLDDIALLRADQLHDIIESDSWLKSQKQNWHNLTTNEKRDFAQELSNRLLRKNGVPYDKTPIIKAEKLRIGNKGAYDGKNNITIMDFDQVKDFESFIGILAHENGGHAIDYLNPNAGALGSQLQDSTRDLFGASYDAYRAKPTEQTAWRIGDIASVVNSYDNTDLQDVLLMAIHQDEIIPYNNLTKKTKIYEEYGELFRDLFFNPDTSTSLVIDVGETENYMDIAKTLIDSGLFDIKYFGQYGQYIEFIPRKLEF